MSGCGMSEKPETTEDIIAEMRGIRVREFQDYADRLDAAHKREVDALNEQIADLRQQRDLWSKRAAELVEKCNEQYAKLKQVGDAAKLREAISNLRTALKEIRNDVLDMVMNYKSEDPDSYAHGLCLSIGGACDMALNSTKEFDDGDK